MLYRRTRLPLLRGKVAALENFILIFEQTPDSTLVLPKKLVLKCLQEHDSVLLGIGANDLTEHSLGFRVPALGQFVEHVSQLVKPTLLLSSRGPDIPDGGSHPRRAVANSSIRRFHAALAP